MTVYPLYVDDLGQALQAARIPAAAERCTLMAFFVDGDHGAMQALVDKFLNAPTGGAMSYSVIGHSTLVSFSFTERDVSLVQEAGYAPNYENAFWIPLLARFGEDSSSRHIVFWMPYIFISGSGGMITGREVLGFRKALATITMPLDPDSCTEFTTTTDVIDPLDNQTAARPERIARVSCNGRQGTMRRIFSEVTGMFRELSGLWAMPLQAVELWTSHRLPIVNLKQFRDSQDSTRACYQAIVETACRPTKVYAGGVMDGSYCLELSHYASHRIAEDLGIRAPCPVRATFWTKLDYDIEAGVEAWRA